MGGDLTEKVSSIQVVGLTAVVAFVALGCGYVLAGGVEKFSGQYSVGEDIVVSIKLPGETEYTDVNLKSGMTVLDAVAQVYEIKTELYPELGPAVKSIDDNWLMYTVDGVAPEVGMSAYQLTGGEKIELTLA